MYYMFMSETTCVSCLGMDDDIAFLARLAVRDRIMVLPTKFKAKVRSKPSFCVAGSFESLSA